MFKNKSRKLGKYKYSKLICKNLKKTNNNGKINDAS